jgi:hypothetical protein
MFGQGRKKLFKPKFLEDLRNGKRKPPQHVIPRNLTENGQECYGAESYDFQFFDEFHFFGEVANLMGLDQGPWSVHEVPETEIGWQLGYDSPQYGRKYEVWYNRLKAGTLAIAAAPLSGGPNEPFDGTISATLKLNMFPPRLLDYHDIAGFMQHIAIWLEFCPGSVSKNDIQAKMDSHLLPMLWRIDLEDENGWMSDEVEMHFADCFPFHYYNVANERQGVNMHAQKMAELKQLP